MLTVTLLSQPCTPCEERWHEDRAALVAGQYLCSARSRSRRAIVMDIFRVGLRSGLGPRRESSRPFDASQSCCAVGPSHQLSLQADAIVMEHTPAGHATVSFRMHPNAHVVCLPIFPIGMYHPIVSCMQLWHCGFYSVWYAKQSAHQPAQKVNVKGPTPTIFCSSLAERVCQQDTERSDDVALWRKRAWDGFGAPCRTCEAGDTHGDISNITIARCHVGVTARTLVSTRVCNGGNSWRRRLAFHPSWITQKADRRKSLNWANVTLPCRDRSPS
jgi:hypothetical protein